MASSHGTEQLRLASSHTSGEIVLGGISLGGDTMGSVEGFGGIIAAHQPQPPPPPPDDAAVIVTVFAQAMRADDMPHELTIIEAFLVPGEV